MNEATKVLYTWEEFDRDVKILAEKLSRRSVECILGIPRGGLVLAVTLSHKLDLPLVTRTGSYQLLVVDDISDTGKTMRAFKGFALCTATLHVARETCFVPDYYARTKESNTWIVYPWEVK